MLFEIRCHRRVDGGGVVVGGGGGGGGEGRSATRKEGKGNGGREGGRGYFWKKLVD